VAHKAVIRALLSLATGWQMLGKPPVKLLDGTAQIFAVGVDGAIRIERGNVPLIPKPRPAFARALRQRSTDAEKKLWMALRDRRLQGMKFSRQVPIESYVVDFLCRSSKLIIELDGGQHDWQSVADDERTRWLEAHGYRVIRFWNNDILGNLPGVLDRIAENFPASARVIRPLTPTLSPGGRGSSDSTSSTPTAPSPHRGEGGGEGASHESQPSSTRFGGKKP
jgi:very-short-patch-repair endonuclease